MNEIKEFVKQLKFRQDIQRDYRDKTYTGPYVKDIIFYKKTFKDPRIIKAIKKELIENQGIPKEKIISNSWTLFGDLYIQVRF